MSIDLKKMFYGTMSQGTNGNFYTTPAGKKAILKNIAITNTTSADITAVLYVAGQAFLYETPIQAKKTLVIDSLSLVLDAGDIVSGYIPTTDGAGKLFLSGVEETI